MLTVSNVSHALRVAITAATLCVSACSSIQFEDGVIACGEAGCPSGLQCAADGTCRRSPLGAADGAPEDVFDGGVPDGRTSDPDPDASTPEADGGVMAEGCGKTTLIADDFDDGIRDPIWRDSTGGPQLAEVDGVARISVTGQGFAKYRSGLGYDLTDSYIAVEVPRLQIFEQASALLGIDFRFPNGEEGKLRLRYKSGQLEGLFAVEGNQLTMFGAVPYEPVAHRWWRIRESGGTVYFEASANGSQWQRITSGPAPFALTHVQVRFMVGSDDPTTTTSSADFDNFNGGTPQGSRCALSSLRDDFSDYIATLAQVFTWQSGDCSIDPNGGRFSIRFVPGGNASCGMYTRNGYDGRNAGLTVQVPEATPSGYTFIKLDTLAGDYAEIVIDSGQVRVRTLRQGGNVNQPLSMTYNPGAHRWFRFGGDEGRLLLEVSSNATTWQRISLGPLPFDFSAVRPALGAGDGTSTASTTSFDDIGGP